LCAAVAKKQLPPLLSPLLPSSDELPLPSAIKKTLCAPFDLQFQMQDLSFYELPGWRNITWLEWERSL